MLKGGWGGWGVGGGAEVGSEIAYVYTLIAGVVGGDLVAGFACISVCKDRFFFFFFFGFF